MIFSVFPIFLDLVAQRGERLELLIDKTENLVDSVSMGYFSECKVEKLRLMANIIGQCLKFSPVVFSSFSNLHYVIML